MGVYASSIGKITDNLFLIYLYFNRIMEFAFFSANFAEISYILHLLLKNETFYRAICQYHR